MVSPILKDTQRTCSPLLCQPFSFLTVDVQEVLLAAIFLIQDRGFWKIGNMKRDRHCVSMIDLEFDKKDSNAFPSAEMVTWWIAEWQSIVNELPIFICDKSMQLKIYNAFYKLILQLV